MPDRIGDLRTNIATLEEATALMTEIGQLTGVISYREARTQVQINKILSTLDQYLATSRKDLDDKKAALSNFIAGNRHLFKQPRKVKTSFGAFGLQDVTEVEVLDEERAIKHLMKEDLQDLFKVTTSLVKPAIRKAIEDGAKIPGIRLKTGDTVIVTPAKSIVEAAQKRAQSEV